MATLIQGLCKLAVSQEGSNVLILVKHERGLLGHGTLKSSVSQE